MNPVVSIIICTRNRAEHLRETLASLARVTVPPDLSCEVLVIDNGPTDDTANVVAACRISNMPVRYVTEPRAGKGYAYNAGLAAVQGQVILFTDDDVRLPPNWIEGMARPIVNGTADAVAGGVQIAPHLQRDWQDAVLRAWLASTDGIDPEQPNRMVGANMAFARAVLERVPSFDTELGPGALGFGDETLFARQLMAAGYRLISAFDTVVVHHFQDDRLLPENLLNAAQKQGQSEAYLRVHWEHKPLSRPWLRMMSCQLRKILRRHIAPEAVPTDRIAAETQLEYHLHLNRQYIRERRRPRQYAPHGLVKLSHE